MPSPRADGLSRGIAAARRHPLIAIWSIAFALRIAFIVIASRDASNFGDAKEYEDMGRELLAGHGFADYVGYVRPPLYPVFVALCFALGGTIVLQVAQALLGATTAVLIGRLAGLLADDRRVAPPAALVAAFYPWFLEYVGVLASETLFTFCAVAAFCAVVYASARPRLALAALTGIVYGIAALARSNALAIAPAIAAWWGWRAGRLAPAVVFGAGIVAALVPFAAYNVATGNGLVLASSGGGMVFYMGNSPLGTKLYDGSLAPDDWIVAIGRPISHPIALADLDCPSTLPYAAFNTVCAAEVPLSQRERFYYERAFRYIRSAPGEWAATTVRKAVSFWRPWAEPRLHGAAAVLVSGASFSIALFLAALGWRRLPRASRAFVLVVAIAAWLTTALWLPQLRYRSTLLDPVLIAAGAAPARSFLLWAQVRLPGIGRRTSVPRAA